MRIYLEDKVTMSPEILNVSGVYAVFGDGVLIYVGMTGRLRLRLQTHRTFDRFKGIADEVRFIPIDDFEQMKAVERWLIMKHKPKFNITYARSPTRSKKS